jgi:acetylornithine deacetylase/succinyl-diaminopimelate desuccinylase-like protein
MRRRRPLSFIDIDAPAFEKTRAALTREWGRDAASIGSGGSIPVNHTLKSALGMDVILAGFALDDDRVRSPNEKYNLESVHKGMRSWVRVLKAPSEA